MAHIGTTNCPQITATGSGAQASVTTLCGLTSDVETVNGEPLSTCPEGHVHVLSASYVTENVTLD